MWLGDAGFDEWWFLGESVILRRGAGRFETCPYVRNTTLGRSRTAPTIGPLCPSDIFPTSGGNPATLRIFSLSFGLFGAGESPRVLQRSPKWWVGGVIVCDEIRGCIARDLRIWCRVLGVYEWLRSHSLVCAVGFLRSGIRSI